MTLESIFIDQHATLTTHDRWSGDRLERPYFHIWPLIRAYKTVDEAIIRWKNDCQSFDSPDRCMRGHHFTRITQYPLNTPDSYYKQWKTDSYMAQYCYLQDEHKKEAVSSTSLFPDVASKSAPTANMSIYFGDDGTELINPKNHYASNAHQSEYFGISNGRGSDLGWHFRDWWLKKHKLSWPEKHKLSWPNGDNPNNW